MRRTIGFREYNPCMMEPFKIWMACISGQFHGQNRINENPLMGLDIGISLRTNKIRFFTQSDYFTHSLTHSHTPFSTVWNMASTGFDIFCPLSSTVIHFCRLKSIHTLNFSSHIIILAMLNWFWDEITPTHR